MRKPAERASLQTGDQSGRGVHRPALFGSTHAPGLVSDSPEHPDEEPAARDVLAGVTATLQGIRDGVDDAHGNADSLREALLRASAGLQVSVAALERLGDMLAQDAARLRQLQRQLANDRAALARARAQLVGSRAAERLARHRATHDSLTALPNRASFLQRLMEAIEHAAVHGDSLAVLYIDLDGFKPVNDAHGHAVGDMLLKILAARLARMVRDEDTMSRLGGDEFGCLLTAVPTRDELCQLTRKLIHLVSRPVSIGQIRIAVGASVGIAVFPTDGTTAVSLLHSADAAMYRAKQRRSGYAFCD